MSDFDLNRFRKEFLQSDSWMVSDCYKTYDDKFIRKDAQDAYEGAKWGFEAGAESRQAEIDELQKRIDDALVAMEQSKPLMIRRYDAIKALHILKGENND